MKDELLNENLGFSLPEDALSELLDDKHFDDVDCRQDSLEVALEDPLCS